MRWGPAIRALLFVVYPLVVYVALEYVEAKYLGVALLVLLGLRYRKNAGRYAAAFDGVGWIVLVLTASFVIAVWWSNDEWLLRLYPALFNLIGLGVFAYTLWRPPSMIERFARLEESVLSADAIRYTRRLTLVWCVFFVCNGLVATYTALFATREAWTLYNGFIAYGLMGALFFGEWLVRRHFISQEAAR